MKDGPPSPPPRRGPSTFRQRDIVAAIKAVEAAGKTVYGVEVARDGRIRVITVGTETAPAEANEWASA